MKLENNIGWCDVTTNPGIGCRGCELGDDCYAKFDTPARVLRAGKWPGHVGEKIETFGPVRTFVPTKSGLEKLRTWNKLCICDKCHETQMFSNLAFRRVCNTNGCKGELRRIRAFCDSNSDWMDWPTEVLVAALDEIRNAPNVDVILLTKWPWEFEANMKAAIDHIGSKWSPNDSDTIGFIYGWLNGHPPAHVITLTSVLGNALDEKRIAGILAMPSACRGFSCEPLWSGVGLLDVPTGYPIFNTRGEQQIHWVIVGCDSSKNRKGWENYSDNARQIIQQCGAAGVMCYHKQMPFMCKVSLKPEQWPVWARVREFYPTIAPINADANTAKKIFDNL